MLKKILISTFLIAGLLLLPRAFAKAHVDTTPTALAVDQACAGTDYRNARCRKGEAVGTGEWHCLLHYVQKGGKLTPACQTAWTNDCADRKVRYPHVPKNWCDQGR